MDQKTQTHYEQLVNLLKTFGMKEVNLDDIDSDNNGFMRLDRDTITETLEEEGILDDYDTDSPVENMVTGNLDEVHKCVVMMSLMDGERSGVSIVFDENGNFINFVSGVA